MSLQFIMGPSGSGKSHYLYEYVITESEKNPKKKYIFIVPEQFSHEAQKELVMRNPNKGLLNIEVLSFHRLAHRIFEETGEGKRLILDEVGKNFVIRKVAGDLEGELKILSGNLKKPGYISEIKSILSELMQYNLGSETLEEMLQGVKDNPNLYYKLNDVKKVFEGFQAYLAEQYITSEEILDVLTNVASKSRILKDSVIIADGFTGFTPIQNKLLRKLFKIAEKILISVTMDKRENPFLYQHPYQLFALSKKMVSTLMQDAKEEQILIEDPVYLYREPAYRFRDNEALAFLEAHLFRYSKAEYQKTQDSIQIWCAKNPLEEMDFVAQKIRELIRTKGYRYRDVAVLTNDIEAYVNPIEQTFTKYELPIFMDHKRSILLNSFVEYIRSLLAMAEQDFTYESVFRYLRTGLCELKRDDIDVLENYVIATGIRGYKKWQEKWIRRTRGMDEPQLQRVNQIREYVVELVSEVMGVLKSRHKTVFDVTKALHSFLLKEELQRKVKDYQERFEQEGELALEKEYAQVYRIVIDLFDQFVELLGEEKISLKEYCELLDAGLEEAKVGIIPPSVDQIVIGDVERSRIKDVKVVFLIGVNDVYIPGSAQNKGLLSEYDRQKLTEKGAVLAPGAKEKTYIQKFYLYLILTKPTHQVYLTYSKTSAEGGSLRPSYLIYDLQKLYSGLQVMEVSHLLQEQELTENSGLDWLIKGLWDKREGLGPEWQELYTWYKKHPKWSAKIEQIVKANFFEKGDTILNSETAKQLYGEILTSGVTRLEKYAACAYAHFLTYGLRLREREEYQFRAVDMGNLFHGAIEKFSRKLEKGGYTWLTIPQDAQNTMIEESVDECIVDYGNSILYSSARNEYVILRLKRMLRRTVWALRKQLEKGDFIPAAYEIAFGGGKIDRVDVCEEEDKRYVKIIDYKTGEKALDLGELCYGLQVQLVVYMNAALEMQKKEHPDKEVIPAGIFYYRVKDPIVSKPGDDTDLETVILQELRPDGVVQSGEEVLRHLDRNFTGNSFVMPVSRTQNGGLSKTSKVLTREEFEIISSFASKKVEHIKEEILQGETNAKPYELGGHTGCDYCPYRAVCRFEEDLPGYEYRKLDKLDKERALEEMRKEVSEWE